MKQAIEALQAGEVIVIPTDTVYGIAALPGVPGATQRLFELKGRADDVPLAVLCADPRQALALGEDPGPDVRALAEQHWPGPLTLVLRRRTGLGYELGRPDDTIGLRCPNHDLVRALAARVGPIATTSANPHGKPTPDKPTEVAEMFGDGVTLVIDGGVCGGEPSTVVDVTGPEWRVLRQGALRVEQILRD